MESQDYEIDQWKALRESNLDKLKFLDGPKQRILNYIEKRLSPPSSGKITSAALFIFLLL
jgi:hypothetical protein